MALAPVRVLVRAKRVRLLRNAILAVAAVVATAVVATAAVVWPVGHDARSACAHGRVPVAVGPLAAIRVVHGIVTVPVTEHGPAGVVGCVDQADLRPAAPAGTDSRG